MALQIRRGLETDRSAVTPAAGELLYTTDEKLVYVGDGTTAGGNLLAGGGGGSLNNVIEDTSPQLGGDLDLNGYRIVTSGNSNIELDPDGTGNIILHGNLSIDVNSNITKTGQLNITPTLFTSFGNNTSLVDGNVYITRNSYSNAFTQGLTLTQHHATADAVNTTFYRSRGTGVAPTAVLNGDDIADLAFLGHDGTARAAAAAISVIVEGSPVTGHIPAKVAFATDNGTAFAYRAELSPAGVWKVNSIQNYSGSDLTLTATNIKMVGDVQINAQGDLKFADSDSSNYVAFQAPSTITSNITWTLPAVDGASGEVLSTDGSGTLSWVTASGGGTSLGSRATVAGTSASLSNNASGDIDITGYKGYILYKIQTSVASWVRLYTDSASRTADTSRLEGTDPLPGAGVIAEVITTGASTILISPGAFGFNNESSPTTNIPVRVTNKSGITTDVTVTLVVVQLEA